MKIYHPSASIIEMKLLRKKQSILPGLNYSFKPQVIVECSM